MISTPSLCESPSARLVVKKPDLFIVGAPKCGTTAMAAYLGAHPQIYMGKKEMHVFGSDLHFGMQFYRRALPAYLKEFKDHKGARHAGDASVWHLLSSNAAREIHAFNPASRIIVMLREPVEMLYSLYHQFRFDGNEHLPTFEQALAAEKERRAGRNVSRQTYFAQGLVYRDAVRYAEQVQRYLDMFGSERVQVILYDDFAADTAAVYRETLEFLQVDCPRMLPNFKVINGSKNMKHPGLQAVLRDPLVRTTMMSMYPWMPRPVFNALQQVEARILRANTFTVKPPPMPSQLRAKLKAEFAPEVEKLSELLGRDLTHWSK